MHIGIKYWNKKDWSASVIICLFLGLHLAIAKYPVLWWDSGRYLFGAFYLTSDNLAPTLTCFVISPFVKLFGIWGFPTFQIIILTYVLVSVLKFFHKNFFWGIICILMSAAGFLAIQVMMDIYTAVGLLALFLILSGNKDAFLYLIASISFIAHYENMLLFPLAAIIYWMACDKKFIKSVLPLIIIIFVTPIILTILAQYRAEKEWRFFPKTKYSMLATQIMLNSPEIANSYIQEYPDSEFSKRKKIYEEALGSQDKFGFFFWDKENGLFDHMAPGSLNKESQRFILYSLKKYKVILLKNSLINTYHFLKLPGYPLRMEPIEKGRGMIDNFVSEFAPAELEYARTSFQYQHKMPVTIFHLLCMISFYLALPIIGIFILWNIIGVKARNRELYYFAIFVFVLTLANAFVMSNFVYIYLRYQLRMLLLPYLAASFIAADFLKNIFIPKINSILKPPQAGK